MQCERARELLSPYVDGELSADERRAVAAHIQGCRTCEAQVADFHRVGRTLAETGREPMPKALALRLRANLAREAEKVVPAVVEPVAFTAPPRRRQFVTPSFLRQAAAMAAVCVVSALATWWVLGTFGETSRLEQDVLAAHMRSLLQDSPIQVASSDTHTVKPWFAGRIDFAPDVKDLSADGFPLIGGRLDYVSGRRVVAVVYKRRLHTINVFMWPSSGPGDAAPRVMTRNGYNLITWSRGGISYWAVSDLNAGDLSQLQGLL